MDISLLVVKTVKHYLNTTLNLITHGEKQSASLLYFGHMFMIVNEMLMNKLEKQTDTIRILLQTLGMEPASK